MDQATKLQLAKIGEMFEEGKNFTEEVLRENERLRLAVQNHQREIKELSQGPALKIRELKARIDILEEDNRILRKESTALQKQYQEADQVSKEYRDRYKYIEKQNSSLLNLYVAAQRLHDNMGFSEVIQAIKELVVSLVGSDSFDICLYDKSAKRLSVLAAEGSSANVGAIVPLISPIVHTLESGSAYISYMRDKRQYDPPLLACIPLKLEEETVGLLLVRSLLYQKEWFDGTEQELIDLLSGQAMTALCASFVYSRHFSDIKDNKWTDIIGEMTEAAKSLENVDLVPAVIW